MYVVYALIDPRDNTVRYVGITDDVYARFLQHIKGMDENYGKSVWIQELRALNKMVIMETLEECEANEKACERESYWIRHFEMLQEPLMNISKTSSPRKAKKTNLRMGRSILLDVVQATAMAMNQPGRKISPTVEGVRARKIIAEEPPIDGALILGKTLDGKRVQMTKEQLETAMQLRKSGKSTGYRDLMGFFGLSEHHAKALNTHLRKDVKPE